MTSLTAHNDAKRPQRTQRVVILRLNFFQRIICHMLRNPPSRFVPITALAFFCATVHAQIPPIPPAAQRSMERLIGKTGSYAPNDSDLNIRIPRINLPIEPWVAFSPEIRSGGILM